MNFEVDMKGFFSPQCETEYFDTVNDFSYERLGDCILKYMTASNIENCNPVILCIGTDRATGDCLGPLVGERMMHFNDRYKVIGNLHSPVHALNIRDVITSIKQNIHNPFVIAIDASLGMSDHIGYITVSNCPISPGKGVNKKLPAIGDISITGIVNVSGRHPGLLQSTRLYTVVQLADYISDALKYSISYLEDF